MTKSADAAAVNGETVEVVDPREIPPQALFHALTWYALVTDSHREKAVCAALKHRGIAIVAPVLRLKRRSWTHGSRRRTLIKVPLLPRYVVAGFDAPPAWLDIFGLRAIRGVVGMDGQPVPVPPVEVARLAARVGSAPVRPGRTVEAGDRAQLLDGPFCHHWVTVERIQGDFAKVGLTLFGRDTATWCPLDILEAA
jgi:transcription antitermination factor NusG